MLVYRRFKKLPQTKLVDGMIDLCSKSIDIHFSDAQDKSHTFLVGGFRTSLENIKKIKYNFVNIDKGYLQPNTKNTVYWRMSYNAFQLNKLFDAPGDRLNVKIKKWNKQGSYIIILAPNPDPLNYYYNDTISSWINKIKTQLLLHTDRKIFVRYKDNKKIRAQDPIEKYFDNCYAVISLQSLGSISATIHGIPCINLAPSALSLLHNMKLENIENLEYPDNRYEWLKCLSYSQFTWKEMENGYVLNTLERYQI